MKKHSVLMKILVTLAVILAALGAAFAWYVGDYSHALPEAEAALAGNEHVSVTRDDSGRIVFAPSGDAPDLHTGLIYYPGGKVEYTAYAPLMEKLAERGITCVLLEVPLNLAILNVNAADDVKQDAPSVQHWYIGGHSLGGVAAAQYLGKGHAAEFDGVVFTGAYTGTDLSGTGLPVLSVIGENDGLVTKKRYEGSLAKLPADAELFIIPGGCHAYFGTYGKQKGDGEPAVTPEQQQETAADVIAEWITRTNAK